MRLCRPVRCCRRAGACTGVVARHEPTTVRGQRGARGYRIWDNRGGRWWGDHYELCPDDLLAALNKGADYAQITAMLKKYRAQKR